jgi:hypothetical protein
MYRSHGTKVATYDSILCEMRVFRDHLRGEGLKLDASDHVSLSSKPSMAVSGTQMTEVGTSGGHSSWNAVWSIRGL